MLQYIHKGHQGKERCLLRTRNTVFWPKITYDIQELLKDVSFAKSMENYNASLEPLKNFHFYRKRMDFLIVTDVFSKYFLVRKLVNSTSAAVCAEITTIVTELGLSHIIRSDNGPCYNSKEFQQLLQFTTSHTTPAALTTQDLMDSLREWLELLRS